MGEGSASTSSSSDSRGKEGEQEPLPSKAGADTQTGKGKDSSPSKQDEGPAVTSPGAEGGGGGARKRRQWKRNWRGKKIGGLVGVVGGCGQWVWSVMLSCSGTRRRDSRGDKRGQPRRLRYVVVVTTAT